MSSKDKPAWAILTNLSPCNYKVNETRHIPTASSKLTNSSSIEFWKLTANESGTMKIENLRPKPEPQLKKKDSFQKTTQPSAPIKGSRGEAVPSIMRELNLNTKSNTSKHLKKCNFIPVFSGQKNSSRTSRATNEQRFQQAPLTSSKT